MIGAHCCVGMYHSVTKEQKHEKKLQDGDASRQCAEAIFVCSKNLLQLFQFCNFSHILHKSKQTQNLHELCLAVALACG